MKTDQKIKYYQLREQGKTQREIAETLGISLRSCNRWEREAQTFSEEAARTAMRLYGARLIDQNASTAAIYAMLENGIEKLNFDNLSEAKKLDLFLKYGRRLEELENKAETVPDDLTLTELAELGEEEAKKKILSLQENIFNLAMLGKISDELARKKIALLTELRKSIDSVDPLTW